MTLMIDNMEVYEVGTLDNALQGVVVVLPCDNPTVNPSR